MRILIALRLVGKLALGGSLFLCIAPSSESQIANKGYANDWQATLEENAATLRPPTAQQAAERERCSDTLTGSAPYTSIDDADGGLQLGHSEGAGLAYDDAPINGSDAVILGTFVGHRSVVSATRRSVYTVIGMRVDAKLKSNDPTVRMGNVVTIFYPGGAARLKNGSVSTFAIHKMEFSLQPNHKYLLFLQRNEKGSFYAVIKAWELTKGRVQPNSILDRDKEIEHTSKYAGKRQASVISDVQAKILNSKF